MYGAGEGGGQHSAVQLHTQSHREAREARERPGRERERGGEREGGGWRGGGRERNTQNKKNNHKQPTPSSTTLLAIKNLM